MTSVAALPRLPAQTESVLLDFDGPLCGIFAGLTAPTIAKQLRDVLISAGANLSEPVNATDDPLEVLRYAGGIGPTLRTMAEELCVGQNCGQRKKPRRRRMPEK